jgi:hypothetical protein
LREVEVVEEVEGVEEKYKFFNPFNLNSEVYRNSTCSSTPST